MPYCSFNIFNTYSLGDKSIMKIDAIKMKKIFESLIGCRLYALFQQPTAGVISVVNMFVINFKNSNEFFSLHTFCFTRFIDGEKIVMTSSDEFYDTEYNQLEQSNDNDNLLKKNMKNIIRKHKGAKVTSVAVTETGDVTVCFDDGLKLEVIIDCLFNDFEYYRFFDVDNEDRNLVMEFNNSEFNCAIEWD